MNKLNFALILIFFIYNITTAQPVVINEINYNSSNTFNTEDWLELYNNTDSTIDLSNWIFKDEEDTHSFVLSSGTFLNAGEFIVLVFDTALFKPLFPNVSNYIGNIGFGLSGGGEKLRLYDSNMNIIDSLTYDDVAPWPTTADGDGPTLSLRNPNLDNSLASSWDASLNHGTPGTVNDNLTEMNDLKENIPSSFSLEQNYPNPFNPVTKIRYSIPVTDAYYASTMLVFLGVYDILGRLVITLVDEAKQAGNFEITFDIQEHSLSSGVYFYQINAGKYSSTKKFVVLK